MNLAVRGNRVLVQAVDQTETTESGLVVLHDYAPDVMGTIIATGDVWDVRVGDTVIFPPSAGQAVDYGDRRYLSLTEDELLAVVEGEA